MSLESRKNVILELGFRPQAMDALEKYLDFLWAQNKELNLISRQMTFAELVDNHVIDCLLPLPQFPKDLKKVADFGSGGGLPGVLYALQFPEAQFHLFEKSPLKQEFLNRCRQFAPNLAVHGEIHLELPGFELVMARAFKPLDVILDVSRRYYQAGGAYFLLKGRAEKIQEEMVLAQKKMKDLKIEVRSLKSPVMDVERNLVLIHS